MLKIMEIKGQPIIDENYQYFNNCHASTLVYLPGGDLLIAYFAGTKEGADDTAIWISRKEKGIWNEPVRTIYQEGIAHWNPVLYREDNVIYLFYKVGPDVHSWKTMISLSEDNGKSWTDGKELVAGDFLPRGPVKNKIIRLSNGHLIAGSSIEDERYWDVFIDSSSDNGVSWEMNKVPFDHEEVEVKKENLMWEGLASESLWENDLKKVFRWDGVIQPTLWESQGGHVHMLMRSTRGKVYRVTQ